jgi:hypothetical protein
MIRRRDPAIMQIYGEKKNNKKLDQLLQRFWENEK